MQLIKYTVAGTVTGTWIIDGAGVHVTVNRKPRLFAMDIKGSCAGQEALRALAAGVSDCAMHLIGGADVAAEPDAKRAIDQGTTRLAAAL